jgi:hypothetical protein
MLCDFLKGGWKKNFTFSKLQNSGPYPPQYPYNQLCGVQVLRLFEHRYQENNILKNDIFFCNTEVENRETGGQPDKAPKHNLLP